MNRLIERFKRFNILTIVPAKHTKFSLKKQGFRKKLYDLFNRIFYILELKNILWIIITPKGIRIPVCSVKGSCPRPLDDGGNFIFIFIEI